MRNTLFKPDDISAEMKKYFEEIEVKCGAPWERVSEKQEKTDSRKKAGKRHGAGYALSRLDHRGKAPSGLVVETKTPGWQPTCECNAGIEACVCLDPFLGSGTVAEVAIRTGRDFIGIEYSPEYYAMAEKRLKPYRNQLKLALK